MPGVTNPHSGQDGAANALKFIFYCVGVNSMASNWKDTVRNPAIESLGSVNNNLKC